LDLLQQQTLEHQVLAAEFLLQLHLKQVLTDQLVEQEDLVDRIAIVLVVHLLVNLEAAAQVEPH
jgi:hypothetical protein